jgi:uncharacterized protein (TIGR03435 family)
MTKRTRLAKNLPIAAAAVAALAVGIGHVPRLRAQDPAAKPLAFEVVSIQKVELPPGQMVFQMRGSEPIQLRSQGNRFTLRRHTLSDLIIKAYDVQDYQIAGIPNWGKAGQDLYDIFAKSEGEEAPSSDQLQQMLQTMLADRFQLKLHRETRELPLYYLVVGKSGLKIKEVPPEPPPTPAPAGTPASVPAQALTRPREMTTFNSTDAPSKPRMITGKIGGLVRLIALFLDRPLIDKTGLTGTYEYPWQADEMQQEMRESGKPAPSVFPTVERLGLKLDAVKGPLPLLVIDHVEKPSAN